MLNRKRLLAMAMSSAMIIGSLAGCSNSSSSGSGDTTNTPAPSADASDETSTAPEESTNGDEGKQPEGPSTIEPNYTVEDGKAITFEDGMLDFIKLNLSLLDADECKLEIADYNGSKALKVTPQSDMSSKRFMLGFDMNNLLGDKVADVASVKMQIGVEASDGNFYPCTGEVYQTHDGNATGTWAVYLEKLNPMDVEIKFNNAYDAEKQNVLMITKSASGGNNADLAYEETGKFSTMYIDNIVFFDADGNAIDVDTTVAFEGPEGYGDMDWSNLVQVKDQVIIDAFTGIKASGWGQAPSSWVWQIRDQEVVDEDGNPVLDDDGNPTVETVGDFDWNSIMKPGMVLTIYFSAPDNPDPAPIWLVSQAIDNEGNGLIGWERINQLKFATNDTCTMAQITFEELDAELKRASKLDEWDYENYYFALQCEAEVAWSVSVVTYGFTE